MLPQCIVGLPESGQFPFLVLELQRQLLVGVLQAADSLLEAARLLQLSVEKRTGKDTLSEEMKRT